MVLWSMRCRRRDSIWAGGARRRHRSVGQSCNDRMVQGARLDGAQEKDTSMRDRVPDAIYPYEKEDGELTYQACRYNTKPKKTFLVRRPDGNGGWIWNIDGIARVLYYLPEVLNASTVFIVEGEKNADDLRSIGLVA